MSALMNIYKQLPVAFSHGQGAWLWDSAGNKYFDSFAGIGVCSLGHAHPAISECIAQQAKQLLHTSNAFIIPNQLALAEKLTHISGLNKAFFANSGAEAVEAALKLTRIYGHEKGIKNPCVIVMEGSFHGRTLATVSASGQRRVQADFEPLVQGFIRAPFNDLSALQTIATNSPDVVAILLEPILGNGGVILPDDNYLTEIRKLCDQYQWLMVLDEVQTGMGRSGKMFVYQHHEILPDILCIAKALGNGIPISACLAGEKACDLFKPGMHGSTLGGNPLACQVALTVLNCYQQEDILANATKLGHYLLTQLNTALRNVEIVRQVRGVGLMIGIELNKNATKIRDIGLENGLLINVTAENVIRLLPPLNISPEEADYLLTRLLLCIEQFLR